MTTMPYYYTKFSKADESAEYEFPTTEYNARESGKLLATSAPIIGKDYSVRVIDGPAIKETYQITIKFAVVGLADEVNAARLAINTMMSWGEGLLHDSLGQSAVAELIARPEIEVIGTGLIITPVLVFEIRSDFS